MEFNERLRYLIDCEEIKIKDLAPKLCLSASTLSNYTQGIREPDYDTLRRIADYFGVSIDYLLGHKIPGRRTTSASCWRCSAALPPASGGCCWSRPNC